MGPWGGAMAASGELVLGVDIGGTKTAYGYVDPSGRCLGAGVMPTDSQFPVAHFFRRLHDHAAALLTGLGEGWTLAGIGIGAPEANAFTGTIDHPANLKWECVNLIEEMGRYYPLPIATTNDANAVAIGELLFGAGKGMRDFIAITLGTGVGSGIVVNGELVYGADGMAGELGHLPVTDRSGRECGCGQLGCLETYASASGIVRTAVELMATRRAPSPLRAIPFDLLTSKMLFEKASQGDALALEAFEVTGRILGAKLADMVLFTRPEAIILFGGLAAAGELIFKPTQRAMEASLPPFVKGKVALLPSGLAGTDAAILGAGALIWNELRKRGNALGSPVPARVKTF
jgi:glucokinase